MPSSKKALIRYNILNSLLQNNFGYTIKELTDRVNEEMSMLESGGKKKFLVSDRMIRMDLENMMDVYPVEIVNKGTKYYYENPSDSIDKINLRNEDKTTIKIALDMLAQFKGTPLFDKFSDMITRIITSSLIRTINTADTSKYIHISETPEKSGVQWVERIYEAIADKRSIVIHYNSFGEKSSVKTISPYLLKEYRNKWYIIANLHGKPDENILMFKLSRIQDIEDSDEPFIVDPSFDADKYFKYTLGVFHRHGEEPIDVKLKVTGKGMIKLLTEEKIHPTQKVTPISDEECIIEITVFDSPELETFILGYSTHIEVLEPFELRMKIIDNLRRATNLYKS